MTRFQEKSCDIVVLHEEVISGGEVCQGYARYV